MGTKLIRLDVPDSLHRRIKTLAAYHDKKIPEYMLEVLEAHVPKGITFSTGESTEKKPRAPN
jgi:hypothetical protein